MPKKQLSMDLLMNFASLRFLYLWCTLDTNAHRCHRWNTPVAFHLCLLDFSVLLFSDAGTGTDAGSDLSNAMILGANPTQAGQGCLDGQDSSDSYQFNLEDYTNVHVMFSPDMGMPFTANLYDEESNMVSGWNGTEWTSMDDMMYEGMDGTFTLVIDSAGAEGYYNISINSLPPAEADLAVSNLTCGSEMISNEELFYSFEIHNLRGPAILSLIHISEPTRPY